MLDPTPRHRLFFALLPTDSVRPHLGEMKREYCPAHGIPDDHWHVTLDILEDCHGVPDGVIRQLMIAGSRIDVPAFVMRLERIVGLGGWVGLRVGRRSAALMRLHVAIRQELRRAGFAPRAGWNFNPHLTLGYPKGAAFSRAVTPIEWEAQELVLIHSHLGQTRHEELGRWALAPELPLFQ